MLLGVLVVVARNTWTWFLTVQDLKLAYEILTATAALLKEEVDVSAFCGF